MRQDYSVQGKKEVNEVIEAFTKFTGLEPTPKTRQRQYANTLSKILGDKTMDVVHYAISIQGEKYAPMVSSPKDLYYKVNDVMNYKQRQVTMEGGAVSL
jgi:hypothetical protein